AVIDRIWRQLPVRFKYHHQLRRLEHEYENWDCSTEGFEGIRAQDILPLCVERFEFRRFLGWASLVEILIDRGFVRISTRPTRSTARSFTKRSCSKTG